MADSRTGKLAEKITPLVQTPLHALHDELGAAMVSFAGYDMPLHYPSGIMAEHHHTRRAAGLFDVSHMGQARLYPAHSGENIGDLFASLAPGNLPNLKNGHICYTQLTNENGGVRDDLMVTRMDSVLWLVVNAACKYDDFSYIAAALSGRGVLGIENRALLALQGPLAAHVLAQIFPQIADLSFMQAVFVDWQDSPVLISRCGYTGEDGFEISLLPAQAESFARLLLAFEEVAPAGLGARDSLRLEAGLCLYGQDLNTTITPVEAGLGWSIPSYRRAKAASGSSSFPGADIINRQLADGPKRKRVGIIPAGRIIARAGAMLHADDDTTIGMVTSGGYGPSFGGAVAMGYVLRDYAQAGTKILLTIRGKRVPAEIVELPFVPHRYFRKPARQSRQ